MLTKVKLSSGWTRIMMLACSTSTDATTHLVMLLASTDKPVSSHLCPYHPWEAKNFFFKKKKMQGIEPKFTSWQRRSRNTHFWLIVPLKWISTATLIKWSKCCCTSFSVKTNVYSLLSFGSLSHSGSNEFNWPFIFGLWFVVLKLSKNNGVRMWFGILNS